MARILVIDVDDRIRKFLGITLGASGHEVMPAGTAAAGLATCRDDPPDLVLLDLALPDLDGLDLITAIRRCGDLPIVVVSARADETAKVEALERGADDYVVKPFGVAELMARVRAALRHKPAAAGAHVLRIGDLVIDLGRRLVSTDAVPVRLSRTEFDLLAALAAQPDHVLSHHALLEKAWGGARADDTDYLRVFIYQLRRKLEKDPAHPRLILTEPGIGYRLRTSQEHSP
jgi:two-component system KDP operon response regulator KdpE